MKLFPHFQAHSLVSPQTAIFVQQMFHWQRLLPPGGAGEEGFQRLLQNILKNNLPSAVEDSPLKVKQGSSCGQKAWQEGRRALCHLPGLALSTAISEKEQLSSPVPDGEKMASPPSSSSALSALPGPLLHSPSLERDSEL